MIILDYSKKHHSKIIQACVAALKQGNVVAYATDTSYGFAVDATNIKAIKKLYRVKGREEKKPSSVVVPSLQAAKKLVEWNGLAGVLIKKFWPGALTIALKLKSKQSSLKKISSPDGFLSLRMPNSQIALDLAKYLGKPITATSANRAGLPDNYSAATIIEQFKQQKNKPDIIINSNKSTKRKPSTIVKIEGNKIEIIRKGPVSKIKIFQSLNKK